METNCETVALNNYDLTTTTVSNCSLTGLSSSNLTTNNTSDYTIQMPITTTTYPYWIGNYGVQNTIQTTQNEKDNNEMNNEYNFGPYNTSNVRLSPYGMAIKNKAGKWVSYDKETETLIDVDIININIDSKKVFYKIPKSVSAVDIGDIVLHNDIPVFVEAVKGNKFVVVNPYEGTELTIIAPTSPYGYNYIPVIISLTDYFPIADNDNPFGNLLPLLLAENNNSANLLPILLATNKDLEIDPLLLLACSSDNLNPYLLMALGKTGQSCHKINYANDKAQEIGEKLETYRTKTNNAKRKAD